METVTINPARQIASVSILDSYSDEAGLPKEKCANPQTGAEQNRLREDLKNQKATVGQALTTVRNLVDKLNQFCEKVFAEHREQIARLSVEIARKILMRKVQEGDYEIESIIKETLKNAPTHQDVVVHLNPEDHVQIQKLQQDDTAGGLSGIKFVADANVGRAECLLETGKGIIKSLIDEHLKQIGKALEKAE